MVLSIVLSIDAGSGLLGLRWSHEIVFSGIEWSTQGNMRRRCRGALNVGLSVYEGRRGTTLTSRRIWRASRRSSGCAPTSLLVPRRCARLFEPLIGSGARYGAIVGGVNLRPYLDLAVQTAYEAGRLTLGYFRTEAARPEFKPDDTPVTAADREAEKLIRARIRARCPGHAVVGEEYGEEEGTDGDHRWIVDPIDGTKSFVRGIPLYGVLIGLEIEGVCNVGVAYFPALDEIVCAATGEGCYCNGRRVRVATTEKLAEGIVSFTDATSFEEYGRQEAWERVLAAASHGRGWSDAYGHALVATGRVELMLDPVMNFWDCGPFPPILREAGGFFGDWSGNETIYGGEAMSTTQKLLPEVLALIQQGKP
jgi:histidinol-phosphatase